MTLRQQATIIAALREFRSLSVIDGDIRDIATNGGKFTMLSKQEIDELIEQLPGNHPPVEDRLSEFKAEFDAKLAAMSDEEIVQEFADLGIQVSVQSRPAVMTDIQRLCWEGVCRDYPGIDELDDAFIKAVDDCVRVFKSSDCKPDITVGEFVITENDPSSSVPPCNYVAWKVVKIADDRVTCVRDLAESERVSNGLHNQLRAALLPHMTD